MRSPTRTTSLFAAVALAASALILTPTTAHAAAPGALSIDVLLSGPESVAEARIPFSVKDVVPGPGPELTKRHSNSKFVEVCGGIQVDVDPIRRTVRVHHGHTECGYARVQVSVSAPYIRNLRVVSDNLFGKQPATYTRSVSTSPHEVTVLWKDPDEALTDPDLYAPLPPNGSAVFTWDTQRVRASKPLALNGTPGVGQTLTVANAVPANFNSPGAKVVVQWLRKGRPIQSATSPTYRLSRADKGKKLTVRVTTTAYGMAPSVVTLTTAKIKRR